ncbi:MAG: hypothetical protein ABEK12_02195, partial [Candidatus Nanohaloarchaea archaeon]
MGVRTGYVHALEGMIAALIVVFYLTSIVSVPATTDWTRTRLSKTSEDLLSALDRSGFLDDVVMRNDPESFSTFVRYLEGSVGHAVQIRNIPPSRAGIAVLANNSSTVTVSTTVGDWGGTGLPVSYSPYRRGNLSTDSRFGDVPFVLSDGSDDSVTEYTMV